MGRLVGPAVGDGVVVPGKKVGSSVGAAVGAVVGTADGAGVVTPISPLAVVIPGEQI